MLSRADSVQGQGVLSAHDEQVSLVKDELSEMFKVYHNDKEACNINHYHTINVGFFLKIPFMKRKGKTVGYVHFLPETLEKSIRLPWFARLVFYKYVIKFYKSMDYLVTVNPYFIDVLETYGIPRSKVSYIPNFVSEEKFYKIDDKAGIRKSFNIPRDKFVVLCVGQLQKRKGVLEFIEIARSMPDCLFLWAGDFAFGKIADGYSDIKKAMENLPPNVRFLGLIDRDDMNKVYNLADVMFLPSYEELFPMAILESMNCSVPILLRDLDIYENILFDFYSKADNNKDFALLLRRLKEDKAFYEQCAAASNNGHVFYSRENVTKMWKDFYLMVSENRYKLPLKRSKAPK